MVKRVFKDDPDVQVMSTRGFYKPTQFSSALEYEINKDWNWFQMTAVVTYDDQELENLITFLEDCLTHMRSR